ncbi:MAG: ABC transporter permease [Hyphomicrobiaceae bacterium]|nr:MAG: ABC transporter permease [Hyphomicrobiaceae bacterium]
MSAPLSTFRHRFARNRAGMAGLVVVGLVTIAALVAPLFYPGDPLRSVASPEIWPFIDARFPLGTDALGRDIAAIMFHGARTTIVIGLTASLVASVIGTTIGSLAGYYGGLVDDLLMRVAEMFQIIPHLVFLIALVAVLGPRVDVVVIGIGMVSWNSMARLVRAEFMTLKHREFVLAARAVGMSNVRIILREILPNALPPTVILASLIVGGAVLFEAALSFLGLSDPTIASWGRLIGEGRSLIRTSWYIAAIPGVGILLTVLSLNLIGDALTDALNPRISIPTDDR